MRAIWILFATLLFITPAYAVVINCANEGNGVVRIDYDASSEAVLPIAFALDIVVDGNATISNVYDFKSGDSNASSPGYGIFPGSILLNEDGNVISWGTPVSKGLGTSVVTIEMASRYSGIANAPQTKGTLCRILVNTNGSPIVNVNVAANTAGGGIVLQNAAIAALSASGTTLGGSSPTVPMAPAAVTYPASSSTGLYTVSWTSSSGATSYQLERSNNAGSTWLQIYSGGNLTYLQTVGSGSYRYRVMATNTVGSSGWTTGTTDCTVSVATPPPPSTGALSISKCLVHAGNNTATDSIAFSGSIDVSANDFIIPGTVVVTISSANTLNPCVQAFPIDSNTFKSGKYKCTRREKPQKTSFGINTKTSKFSFSAKNVSLKGLSIPVHIEIQIGNYTGTADIDETIVNGARTLIPIKLMMGVKDSLRVDKFTAKRSAKPNRDSFTAKGGFAVLNTGVNMTNMPFVVTLGAHQTFTIPAGIFKANKSGFACSRITLSDGSVASANFNFTKGTFKLTIKSAAIEAGEGSADLRINFALFDKVNTINLPQVI